MTLTSILLLLLSLVSGALPSGYIIAKKFKGIDIREYGSGNPGSANVYRIVGKWAGWLTLFFDAMKGCIPVLLARYISPENYYLAIACGVIAILSHMWTFMLGFKGGKGVATSLGVFGALLPIPTGIAFFVFIIVVAITKHISAGSIAAGITLPLMSFIMKQPLPFSLTVTAVALLIIYKHIPNIKRMLSKQELNFEDGTNANLNEKKRK